MRVDQMDKGKNPALHTDRGAAFDDGGGIDDSVTADADVQVHPGRHRVEDDNTLGFELAHLPLSEESDRLGHGLGSAYS